MANGSISPMGLGGSLRVIKVILWTLVCFLLAPSKAAAVAYCLLGGFLVISVFVVAGILGIGYKGIRTLFGGR